MHDLLTCFPLLGDMDVLSDSLPEMADKIIAASQ